MQRRVGQVFVSVRDTAAAIRWYAAVLGFEPDVASHDGTISDIPTDGETWLALDANRPDFLASGPPRFFLWTDDMASTVEHLRALDVRITSDVEDIGSVISVQFEDHDGNAPMVCLRA
ncbi:VOC family protein [Terrabacter sp. Soil810]|uniref:VOC family protein n=1 Tax=Terrabacter sp. Soil810 TaxID=1736418 RepID=UPI00070A2D89|nr:VOC family protein [Terrabacter sp. Soil810]KRF40910.1 hypothetical protein ASG96_08860 [Terrabacter sp. Soil810]